MADWSDFTPATTDNVPHQQEDAGIAPIPQGSAPVLSPTSRETFGQVATYGLPGLGVGLLDTLGQSIGVLHKDTIPDAMKNYTGQDSGTFGDFYSRNQAALRTGGEIAGMLLPGLAGMKVLKTIQGAREAGSIGAFMKNSAAMDVLLGNSANLTLAEGAVTDAATQAARLKGVYAARAIASPELTAAKGTYYAKRAVDAARTTAAFELGNYVGFNSSQTFYPPDAALADQVKWGVGGAAVGVALDFVASKYAVRNIIQTVLKNTKSVAEEASPLASSLDQVIFRPGQRGVGITLNASVKEDLAHTIASSGNPPQLKTALTQDTVVLNATIGKQLELLGTDSHAFLPKINITPAQKELGMKALDQNPTAFVAATKLANLPPDPEEFYSGIAKSLDKAKTDYNTATFAASSIEAKDPAKAADILSSAEKSISVIEDASNEIHYVIENDGTTSIFKNRAPKWLDTGSFADIKKTAFQQQGLNGQGQTINLKKFKMSLKIDNDVSLYDNFMAEIPKGATSKDYSGLYGMGSKMIADWKVPEGPNLNVKKVVYEVPNFILTPKLDWRTTEMTVALAKSKPESQQFMKFGDGFTSLDDAEFSVLNAKFKDFNTMMPTTERPPISAVKSGSLLNRMKGNIDNYTPAEVIQRLNLPTNTNFTPSPVTEMFAHAKLQGMTDLNAMFPKPTGLGGEPYTQMDLVRQHLRETAGITDQSVTIPTSGNLLFQQEGKPLFVAAKSVPLTARADEQIATRVQAMRDVQIERLGQIDPQQSPLVSGVVNKIVSSNRAPIRNAGSDAPRFAPVQDTGDLSGAANEARAVQTLHDGILSGTGQVVYQDRINEQFSTLKAAQLIAQDGDKFVDNYVATLASKNLTPKMATILSPKNRNDLFDFNRIEQSYRHGWEISKIDGSQFLLKQDSKINAALTKAHFPELEEVPDYMPDMSVTAKKKGYLPLTVSKNAADLSQAISDMSIQSGHENNALRVGLGKNPISLRDFHLPTPDLNKEGTWFIRNNTGKVVATYSGPNIKQNEQRAYEAATKLGADEHTAVPLETVRAQHLTNDDTFFDLIDYSDQLAKTGAGIQGGLAKTEIDTTPTTLRAMVKSLQEQYLNVGIRARNAIFEPELNYAKQASRAANASTRDNMSGVNIFDRYISTMWSQNPTNSKAGFGKLYAGVEDFFDKKLSFLSQNFTELASDPLAKANAKIQKTILKKEVSDAEFAQFQKTLPKWSPFQETNDWAESTFREKTPFLTKGLTTELAKISSTMSLRFLDLGSALNNFAGLMTNAPSVVYGLRRLPNEAQDVWINRTAAWGTQLADGVVTFSPMKALNQSIKALWSGELSRPMQEAAKHGYFEPEYASLSKALATPEKPSSAAIHKFVEFASKAADKSEALSRQISWGMGYKIGKELHGFEDEKNAYIFANNFVNEMIGNYSPNNKPAMFSGAIGMPIGTFQTYMFNLYRRMYSSVERGDKAAIMAQYAAQSSFFGAKSVPGYQAWNSFFQSNQDGSDDFTTRVDRTVGGGYSELLLNGSLAGIPKIFGARDSLALYSRGSIDITQPPATILDASKAPPAQFLMETAKGIKATIQNVFGAGGFSLQQQEEIMARFSTNRAMKSIMELAADVKTSDRGAVIEAHTRDAIHVAASLAGTQPSSTKRAQDAMRREEAVQSTQADRRAVLLDHTRAIMRGGNFDTSDFQGVVHDYLKSGGDPAYLGQWFRNAFSTAQTPTVQKQLETLARSGKMLEFQNMLAAIQENQTPQAQK